MTPELTSPVSSSSEIRRLRAIAFYLPQFYPTPENDAWWEPGYTEWTVVRRARPLFPGHKQPKVPTELGYYDLRDPEVREAQARLARDHGVAGFCYWHYWLGRGRRILERPFDEVLSTGEPDFPFCLGWANHDWFDKTSRQWKLLVEQEYPGRDDEKAHFDSVEPAFHDPRYLRIDGKPLFFIFRPDLIPDPKGFTDHWRALADRSGLPGLFFVGRSHHSNLDIDAHGLDALQPGSRIPIMGRARTPRQWYRPQLALSAANLWFCQRFRVLELQSYRDWAPFLPHLTERGYSFPAVYSNWDCTPRWGRLGSVMVGESVGLFAGQLEVAYELVKGRSDDHRIVFVKSWNEWGEGNYLEPDLEHGRRFLEALRASVFQAPEGAAAD